MTLRCGHINHRDGAVGVIRHIQPRAIRRHGNGAWLCTDRDVGYQPPSLPGREMTETVPLTVFETYTSRLSGLTAT